MGKVPTAFSSFSLFLILIVLFEIVFQIVRRGRKPFINIDKIISTVEFNQRLASGEELCLFNDYVIDVKKFKPNHPGGKFVIEQNVGRDVSKFFFGGYSMDTGSSPHFHSNIARMVMNSLIIGKLERSVPTYICSVHDRHQINSFTQTIVFVTKDVVPGLRTFHSDISMIGKHYLVRKHNNHNVNRHYTISNCMRKDVYEEYIRIIE